MSETSDEAALLLLRGREGSPKQDNGELRGFAQL